MVVLTDLYKGAQEVSMNGNRKWNILQTEFIETRSAVMKGDRMKQPSELSYTEYREECKRRSVDISKKDIDSANVGYTGLRFYGDPSAVESIELEIGGQRIDKLYPSISGQFDSFSLFELVIPNPILHHVQLFASFLKKSELRVEWDVVKFLEDFETEVQTFDMLHGQTQYCGAEDLKEGESEIRLNYNHPIDTITVYADKPVERMILSLDALYQFHISYVGVQNNKYVYKYVFQTPVNFSRIDKAVLKIKSATENTLYPFARSKNIMRFMKGMAGLAFSK